MKAADESFGAERNETGPEEKGTIVVTKSARALRLDQFRMSVRLRGVLERLGCEQLGDLEGRSWVEVERTRNCGKKTLTELWELVAEGERAISLRPDLTSGLRPLASLDIAVPSEHGNLILAQLPLSARLSHVLQALGCVRLGDLVGRTWREVGRVRNCGKGTLDELRCLLARVEEGEFAQARSAAELDLPYLILLLNHVIGGWSPRDREIMLARFGAAGRPQTLEELGARHELTRERVRQLIERALARLRLGVGPRGASLLAELAERCTALPCPLTPEVLVEWMGAEAATCRFASAFYVRLLSEIHPALPTWPDGQRDANPRTERERQLIRWLRAQLLESAGEMPLAEVPALSSAQFVPVVSGGELLAALERCKTLAVELPPSGEARVRLSRLRTREWAQRVLLQANCPLTPEALIEGAEQMFGPAADLITPFALANILKPEDGFYLLDRRAFGLRRHFRLPIEQWPQVKADFYALLRYENHPVSSAKVVNERRFDWTEWTNAYEVAQILREDERFVDLGRFLFALADWGMTERQHVAELIPIILAQAGRPLPASRVLTLLLQFRSVTPTGISHFLRSHPEVRDFGFGYYGLKVWDDRQGWAQLAEDRLFLNRVVARSEQPFSFGDLCAYFGVSPSGAEADGLWKMIRQLPKVRRQPDQCAASTRLTHRRWTLAARKGGE